MSSLITVRSDRMRGALFSHAPKVTLLKFIAERLRELRRKHNLTQEQMADLLKTDLRWYQRVEGGEKDIRATTIDRLGSVFGISGTELFLPEVPETAITAKIRSAPHRPKKNRSVKP